VDPWEITIEHKHVVANDARLQQGVVAVGRKIDRHSLASQATGDRLS
jgi:hypothetical protein